MIKALVLLIASFVPIANATPDPAVVRVEAKGPLTASYGSGTCIAVSNGVGLIITANHTFATVIEKNYTVEFPELGKIEAKLVGVNVRKDLAALTFQGTAPTVPLATENPKLGDEVVVSGYGSSGKSTYKASVGLINSVSRYVEGWYTVDAEARSGDSGGPVMADGHLVGVLWGSARGECYFTPPSILRDFILGLDVPVSLKEAALQSPDYVIFGDD